MSKGSGAKEEKEKDTTLPGLYECIHFLFALGQGSGVRFGYISLNHGETGHAIHAHISRRKCRIQLPARRHIFVPA